MSEPTTTEAPVMLRADITRDELRAFKAAAALEGKTVQQLLAELMRAKVAA